MLIHSELNFLNLYLGFLLEKFRDSGTRNVKIEKLQNLMESSENPDLFLLVEGSGEVIRKNKYGSTYEDSLCTSESRSSLISSASFYPLVIHLYGECIFILRLKLRMRVGYTRDSYLLGLVINVCLQPPLGSECSAKTRGRSEITRKHLNDGSHVTRLTLYSPERVFVFDRLPNPKYQPLLAHPLFSKRYFPLTHISFLQINLNHFIKFLHHFLFNFFIQLIPWIRLKSSLVIDGISNAPTIFNLFVYKF